MRWAAAMVGIVVVCGLVFLCLYLSDAKEKAAAEEQRLREQADSIAFAERLRLKRLEEELAEKQYRMSIADAYSALLTEFPLKTTGYYLSDIDGDSIPELWIKAQGVSNTNEQGAYGYTFNDGKIRKIFVANRAADLRFKKNKRQVVTINRGTIFDTYTVFTLDSVSRKMTGGQKSLILHSTTESDIGQRVTFYTPTQTDSIYNALNIKDLYEIK